MKYNKLSQFEKPPQLCPRTCGECEYFKKSRGICRANNGIVSMAFAFSRPTDRPLPMPLNCPWWYMNATWREADAETIAEYRETRLHELTAAVMLSNMEKLGDRMSFIDHFFRPDGCRRIDFEIYPEAKEIYLDVIKEDGGKV